MVTRATQLFGLRPIEGGRDYEALLPTSLAIDIAGHRVHVLDLATLLELKRGSTRLKDQLVPPVLEETLRQRGDDPLMPTSAAPVA